LARDTHNGVTSQHLPWLIEKEHTVCVRPKLKESTISWPMTPIKG